MGFIISRYWFNSYIRVYWLKSGHFVEKSTSHEDCIQFKQGHVIGYGPDDRRYEMVRQE